ncbi:MAG TPA: restriction endonuclease subunit S [Edaphobacter sp.]|uniref:restriction endonuclease subunit S n=1 Tax=Edaphobacter sp. TaxID=1934404 RepID=UPI002C8AECF7|nr:restriction endonuclease subunit S [Edaphobacter sp.]HUZ96770.1 restriction endonuclease subunit S [Edaphobacter sp.]
MRHEAIPIGWMKVPLAHICGRITTGKLDANAMVADGEYPFFTCASESFWINRYAFDCEALLVSGNGANVGYVHYYNGKFNAYQRTYVLSEFSANARFLRYFLDENLKRRIRIEVNASNTPYITMSTLTEMSVTLPSDSKEQNDIAEALYDVDALVDGLERLIFKKRDLKQAAMQQLLTGQTRLPGFTADWVSRPFGELASPSKQRVDPSRSVQPLYCVELEHIKSGAGRLVGSGATKNTSSQKSIFESDDILFGRLRAYLKKYWLADRSGVCSTEIWVLEVNRAFAVPSYLAQIVQLDAFIQAASSSYGTHMPRSDWNVVKRFEIFLPDLDEQTAIANALSDMDAELAALEQRLAKTRDLKQAMMQELLTGKTHLVAPEVAHA